MKKSEFRSLIREEVRKVLNETAKISDFPDFPYLFKKTNPNSKAVKVDLSSDPEFSRKKDINPIFVVAKHVKGTNTYYEVYYQPTDTSNPNFWQSGHQGKEALQSQLLKKIISVAKSNL